jgi:hypothetical protein
MHIIRVVDDLQGSVRPSRIRSADEFWRIPPLLREPYRTQVWITGFLGLRASIFQPSLFAHAHHRRLKALRFS